MPVQEDTENVKGDNARRQSSAEIGEIKASVDSLKSNVIALARNIKEISAGKAQATADYVQQQAESVKTAGTEALEKTEERIRQQPGQSMAIAFAAGIIASYLLGRRA